VSKEEGIPVAKITDSNEEKVEQKVEIKKAGILQEVTIREEKF
jgi:hypothetical protein